MPPQVQKVKVPDHVIIHGLGRFNPDTHPAPVTIEDINKELAEMGEGIEFLPADTPRDHLLEQFLNDKAPGT